jgi:tetratricopeptide (TPR) repeat protein
MIRTSLAIAVVVGLALFACGGKNSIQSSGKHEGAAQMTETGPTPKQGQARSRFQAPLLEGMGDHRFAISSTNPDAQRFFNQGLILAYGFNHAEAERSFREAARLDPDCAICWWGVAWVLGPNINTRMSPDNVPKAWTALQNARDLAHKASAKEKDLIDALAQRYVEDPPEQRVHLDEAFAQAMRAVSKKYPDDLDIKSIYAEALMDLHPWNYWMRDGKPRPWTPEILDTLEAVLARDENHPQANHLYIHAIEASPTPEKGVPMADRLGALVPGAGHLVHMPAHIYIRVGRYADAAEANIRAIAVDQAYIAQCRTQGVYPLAYHPHNYHFLFASRSLQGRSRDAIEAAQHMRDIVSEDKMREQGWGTLQHYWSTPLYAWVRFGQWDQILSSPPPAADLLYPRGVWHYARAMAFRARGQLDQADAELDALKKIAANPALEKITLWDINPSSTLMVIAVKVVEGEIAARRKQYKRAIAALEEAVALEDSLTYDEPPSWQLPTRLNLGAVQLAAGMPGKAEKTYREELAKFPDNGWSLVGLAAALDAQGKKKQAKEVRARLAEAWRNADIQLTGSRF